MKKKLQELRNRLSRRIEDYQAEVKACKESNQFHAAYRAELKSNECVLFLNEIDNILK
jgi:uncharacterized protein YlxW (UPF0749 family)